MTKRIRIGCDPELFVKLKGTDTPIPVCGRIGGTKARPMPLTSSHAGFFLGKGFALQEDGAALEFNIPPTHNPEDFSSTIRGFMSWLPEFLDTKGLQIYQGPTATFDPRAFEEFPQAMQFGCDPDFDAYEARQRPAIDVAKVGMQRFAAGHFHVGYDTSTVPPDIMAKFLDLSLGLSTLHLDKQGARRQFYGVPGLFRAKPYGVEYRTLSNFWLRSTLDTGGEGTFLSYLARGCVDLAERAQNDTVSLRELYRVCPWADVKTAIETENVEMGRKILDFMHGLDPGLFRFPCAIMEWKEAAPTDYNKLVSKKSKAAYIQVR